MATQLGNVALFGAATRPRGAHDITRLQDRLQPASRALPTWLPAPPSQPQAPASLRRHSVKPAARTQWLRISYSTPGERFMLGLLVFASVGSVGYGFSSLLDLVQNWAQFTLGVAHFVH